MENKKIILGTAQLLNKYGIANTKKTIMTKRTFHKILNLSFKEGIQALDTASSYNNEKDIGNFIKAHRLEKKVKITTKIPSLKILKKKDIYKKLEKSLTNLNIKKFHTIFFHDQNDIDLIIKDLSFFQKLKTEYGSPNFGLSIYDEKILRKINKINFINSIQIPLNMINHEFSQFKYRKNLKIFIRSVFLQGFLINENINYKNLKKKTINAHQNYFLYLKKNKIDPLKLCISYINSLRKFDYYIFGITTELQLKEILKVKKNSRINITQINKIRSIFKNCSLDPRNWISES